MSRQVSDSSSWSAVRPHVWIWLIDQHSLVRVCSQKYACMYIHYQEVNKSQIWICDVELIYYTLCACNSCVLRKLLGGRPRWNAEYVPVSTAEQLVIMKIQRVLSSLRTTKYSTMQL